MSDREEVLALLDDLAKLLEGSVATSIEVETDTFSLRVTRGAEGAHPRAAPARAHAAVAVPDKLQHVHATTVGIFSSTREWQKGDTVERGALLGGIQSLGHMADITAPADGKIQEVLVAVGAPVEYGQALFAIAIA